MAASNVDQAALLADVFSTYLHRFNPASLAVIGCAGGNGFDRIDSRTVGRVVGVDINSNYLDITGRRYSGKFKELLLAAADIAAEPIPCEPVDLCYAALVLEYVEVSAALRNLWTMCRDGGYLVAVLQRPSSEVAAVTPSVFPSLKRLAASLHFVDPSAFHSAAFSAGFTQIESTNASSSAGKQFDVHVYRRSPR